MNTKNLWIAVLSGAVLTTLVSNLPFVGLVNFLCFAGFWASAIFAVWLYRRLNGTLTAGEAFRVGALTGLFAGLLGFVLSFLGVAGLQGLVNGIEQFIPADASTGEEIPAWGALAFNLIGVLFNVIFGAFGGWIGGALFRSDRHAVKA
jgi:hypothetical protein